jgi:hypothetical protein
MAISVDTVYQKVLAFANKEQRGYITPQEFNLFADQAQMEIFEQYFYDINQFRRVPGNDSKYADMVDMLEDKLSYFKQGHVTVVDTDDVKTVFGDSFYRFSDISYNWKVVEEIKYEDFYKTQTAPLTKATSSRPIYYRKDGKIYFEPNLGDYTAHYIKKPSKPNWGYVVVNDKPLYNSTSSTDFELHLSEESELVYRILAFTGISIEKPQLTQIAVGLEGAKQQQEKQ